MIRRIFQAIKVRCFILAKYISIRIFLLGRNIKNNKAKTSLSVYFDLHDIRQEPYYYPIIFALHEADYTIYLANNIKFIGHSFAAGKYIYQLEYLKIGKRPLKKHSLYITDNKQLFQKEKGWERKIYLNPNAFLHAGKDSDFLPYTMNPEAFHKRYFDKFQELRLTKRRNKILFSGNTEKAAYTNPIIHQKFNKLNRVEVIELIIQNLDRRHLWVVKNKNEDSDIYFNGVKFYCWEWSPQSSKLLDIRVPNEDWHSFLAEGDFFLCCPGVVIPLSFNAIEAMAVGTIPILQYPELFHPALEHGQNCIYFSDKNDLLLKLKEVLAFSPEKIKELRTNVISYYEKFLSTQSILHRITSNGDKELFFYNETPIKD